MTLSTANCGAEMVEIDIKDCGSGIAPEDLERIFNLYFTTKERGNGLGLSLALRAIDLQRRVGQCRTPRWALETDL